ncbi:hypothetical protein Clacol_002943 [Clathrus columnatus]|uniref:Formamidase n=1 Tax=Clathrus columnatus TaxID=1419009 RepID=A0AAV5A7J9_9AGAM|nr:hypothetical protein Clacol_002943 [Clathrus columnatus]
MATKANSVPHPTLIKIDPFVPADQQKGLHNRWHPDIPPVVTVKPGEVFKIECIDWTGAQIGNNDTSDDIKNVDLTKVHNLTGPVAVEGAEPGDALVVDILDAREFNSKACKAIWDLEGVYATSRHIPGVKFAGISHPGLIGTAPSQELLDTWNAREKELISQHPGAVPAVAFPPEPIGAYVGQDLTEAVREKIAREGARTIPGREHGGNCDGDLSFCGAIEMAGIITFKTSIIKGGIEKFALKQPIFLPSPVDPMYSAKLVFEGISVDYHGNGKQYNMDATVAYKQAALNAIAYLQKLGYTAPVESHIGAIVDSPNACVTLALPIGIFENDILPKPEGLAKHDYGQCAIRSDGVL